MRPFLILSAATILLTGLTTAQSPDQIQINTPFVTTPPEVVDAMLDLAHVTASDTIYDLGCGDGRIVIAAAQKHGARGVGVDLNPDRIAEANAIARNAGLTHLVHFEAKDLFETDIRDATVVAIYLLPDANLRLRTRLLKELKPGTRVVSHSFDMGDWKPDAEKLTAGARLYLWTIPSR
jgi:SAM-dependent methyltransferase